MLTQSTKSCVERKGLFSLYSDCVGVAHTDIFCSGRTSCPHHLPPRAAPLLLSRRSLGGPLHVRLPPRAHTHTHTHRTHPLQYGPWLHGTPSLCSSDSWPFYPPGEVSVPRNVCKMFVKKPVRVLSEEKFVMEVGIIQLR